MAKYHVSDDGNARVCRADDGKCPLGENSPHGEFTNQNDANRWAEESIAQQYSPLKVTTKAFADTPLKTYTFSWDGYEDEAGDEYEITADSYTSALYIAARRIMADYSEDGVYRREGWRRAIDDPDHEAWGYLTEFLEDRNEDVEDEAVEATADDLDDSDVSDLKWATRLLKPAEEEKAPEEPKSSKKLYRFDDGMGAEIEIVASNLEEALELGAKEYIGQEIDNNPNAEDDGWSLDTNSQGFQMLMADWRYNFNEDDAEDIDDDDEDDD